MQKHQNKAVGKGRKPFAFISSASGCESDILFSIIGQHFQREILTHHWYKKGLTTFLKKAAPACVIVCQGKNEQRVSTEKVWGIISRSLPGIPVVWLVADINNLIPDHKLLTNSNIGILTTCPRSTLVQEFIDIVARKTMSKALLF